MAREGEPVEPKVGYSDQMADYFQATLKKATIMPTEDGSQEYHVVFVIPRNEVTRDLGDWVGHPVMLAIKPVQMKMPLGRGDAP